MSQTNDGFGRSLVGIAVNGYDDAQDLRISAMNRVRDVVRKRNEGIPFDTVEEEKDPSERDYDDKYKDENLPGLLGEMEREGTLTSHERQYIDLMLNAAETATEVEEQYKKAMGAVERERIYEEWLTHVTGIGPTLAARLLHNFGYCEDFDQVSSIWAYSGLAPGQERVKGEKADFSPQCKTLAWLVADRMIMQGSRSRFKEEFYDPYKAKQERRMERAKDMTDAELESVKWSPPESQGHADARARRYLAKKFLKHYLVIARDMQGLETDDEWILEHGGHKKDTESFENPFYAKREVLPG